MKTPVAWQQQLSSNTGYCDLQTWRGRDRGMACADRGDSSNQAAQDERGDALPNDCETLGTLRLRVGWDERDTSEGGVLFCSLLLARVCGFVNFDIYDAILHLMSCVACSGWWRGSGVRTSVFGWRTFPDLRLIYGWHVTTSWVKCPLWVNQAGQLSLPSLGGRQMSSNPSPEVTCHPLAYYLFTTNTVYKECKK